MVKIETVTLKGNNDYQTDIKTLSVEANMKQSRIVCKHCNRYVKPIRDQSIQREDFSEDEWEEIKKGNIGVALIICSLILMVGLLVYKVI